MVCHHHCPCSSVLSPVPSVWLKCIFQEIIFSSFELLLPTFKLTSLNFFGTKSWFKPAVFFSYLALLLQEVLKCCFSDFLWQVAQLKASCYLFPSPLFLYFCDYQNFITLVLQFLWDSKIYQKFCVYIQRALFNQQRV